MAHPPAPARRARGIARRVTLLRVVFVILGIAVIAIVFWPRAAAARPCAGMPAWPAPFAHTS